MKTKAKIFATACVLFALLAVPILTSCKKDNKNNIDAAYSLKTYSVTFVSDGGTQVPAQTVKNGEKAFKPDDPKKAAVVNGKTIDYEFSGWFSGDVEWNFETMAVTEDTVLTAKWTQDYTPPYLPIN